MLRFELELRRVPNRKASFYTPDNINLIGLFINKLPQIYKQSEKPLANAADVCLHARLCRTQQFLVSVNLVLAAKFKK